MVGARIIRGAAVLLLALGVSAVGLPATTAHAAEGDPVPLAVIVPIVAPASETGLIDAERLEEYTSVGGELSRQLDAAIGRPVTLAIDPRVLVSIRVLGTSAPASATQWLDRLRGAVNESFLLTYADSDVTLGTQSGSPVVLEPQNFDFAIDSALFGPANPSPTGTPTPEPTDAPTPALPTTAELLAWDSDFPGLIWPRAGTVAASDLAAFTASGYNTAMLSSGQVARPEATGPSVLVGDLPAIVTDDAVSAALATAANTSTPAGLQPAISSLDAAIAAAGSPSTGPVSVVASFERSVPRAGTNTSSTLAALQSAASVRLVPLSVALEGEPRQADLIEGAQDAERLAEGERLLLAEGAEARFATIVEDSTSVTAPRRLRVLALMSNAWITNTPEWSDAVLNYLSSSEDLRAAVGIVTTSPFTLVADNGALPIPVSNSLSVPVRVFLTVRPLTAQLAVSESLVEVVIEPNAQGLARVPVQAISNGSVQVVMTLSSASGAQIGQPATTEINVQAGWETPIVIVIAVIVVLVFAGGIVRNIVRRRRGHTSTDETATDD
ncbi:hypothetical protein M2152_002559 [Microbacteriaceae bacterium SG_E_30_P1]|uniref:Uncharacterized protein n=1 Tax=Antiquaquibacter oligotrophicus TaxID=2880260 RepID=A0ABT6KQW7_9MICO|nr:DUF6049 family protein [Antiquaquibacter oligotrophicus]MDH6182377.1 hypothetical protein [Antiquaquibacter oligotrophicus]UDF14649.1 DUF6049 family protein [Antiquaquibacter oligotrophicus]